MVNNKCDEKVTLTSDTADFQLYSSGHIKINFPAMLTTVSIALNSFARQQHSTNTVENLNW
ncbi:MAG: hypothetical protein RM368_01045 [Nostoc sp. DedSLP03]|uniref:hypothetical protein n=1 Tax=Nostoc sp. DedSLP03 TaxID=3075400 RepID=UPI002AD52322|nr:hypothetical protein [Nostoc sp. DedSLP03]MDZ7963556.1 hypothetical protein [Nostoc sp. DedSLP03]